jgi:hypothetical protein
MVFLTVLRYSMMDIDRSHDRWDIAGTLHQSPGSEIEYDDEIKNDRGLG